MATLTLTAVVTVGGTRVGLAQWLAFTADIPGVSPTGSPESLARASTLAPRSGPLALWVATQAHRELLSGWLSPNSGELSEAAAGTAREALRAHPANPYAHIHLARVMLDRARRRSADEGAGGNLREQAGDHLAAALALHPTSADVGHSVATVLLSNWSVLDESARAVAIDGVRQVGSLDRLRFPELLRKLGEAVLDDPSSRAELVHLLRGATPAVPTALDTFAGEMTRIASSQAARFPESWSKRALRAAIEAHADAARLSGFEARWSRRWIETAARLLPEELPRLVEETRAAATEHPSTAGAWLARAWAASAAGRTVEARQAADQARQLARTGLIRRLGVRADDGVGGDAVDDARLLALAHTHVRGTRPTGATAVRLRRDAISRDHQALLQAVELLGALGPASPDR